MILSWNYFSAEKSGNAKAAFTHQRFIIIRGNLDSKQSKLLRSLRTEDYSNFQTLHRLLLTGASQ